MSLILFVLFVMTIFLWLLSLVGVFGPTPAYRPWLAWFAVLLLGLAEFVTGPVVWRVP